MRMGEAFWGVWGWLLGCCLGWDWGGVVMVVGLDYGVVEVEVEVEMGMDE